MSQTIHALTLKLNHQLTDLSQKIQSIEQQLQEIEDNHQESRQRIENASHIPFHVVPEQEMARLNYILREQEHQDGIQQLKRSLHADRDALFRRQRRTKSELKQLERYQESQHQKQQQETRIRQQNTMDEWALQQ